MAYYGNYNQQCQSNNGTSGLAGYGGGAYAVGQPAYYAGPSYSTTSDNDFGSLPVAGYGTSYGYNNNGGYSGGYATTGAYNGAYYGQQQQQAYNSDPYAAYNQQYQQQQAQQISYTQPQTNSMSQQCPPGCAPVQQQCPPGCQPVSQSDDLSQLAPQIEAAYEAATGQRRQPVIKRQVITVPGSPGKVQQVVRRLPTPTPDVVERVFIVKPQRDVVNLVIERPGTPPAQYRDRTIMGKQRRPLINPRIVRVAARSQITQYQTPQNSYNYSQCQQQVPQYTQQVQALPPPSPTLNVQTVRVPHSSYHQYSHSQSPQCPPGCQPALSQQYQPQMSTGQMSQAQLSQASQTQLQCSQQQLTPTPQLQPKGYLIAPVQYEDCGNNNNGGYAAGSGVGVSSYGAQPATPTPLAQPYTSAGYGGYGSYGAYYGGYQNNYAAPGTLPGYGASMYGVGGYGNYGRPC